MIRRLKKGEPLNRRIIAADWSRIAAATERVEALQQIGGDTPSGVSQTIAYVRNDSDADVDRGEILAINGPLITEAENDAEFMLRPTFSGVKPLEPDHVGKFVIALEPLAKAGEEEGDVGQIGRCVVAGVTLAKVKLRYSGGVVLDQCADIEHESFTLRSGSAGAVRLLATSEINAGVAWCIVLLAQNDAGVELAEIQSVEQTNLACRWIDQSGAPFGPTFDVYVYSYTDENSTVGQVTLNADPPESYPTFAAGQRIRVYRMPRTEYTGIQWRTGFWAVDRVDRWCEAT